MAELRNSVLEYIYASKRLLESEALSELERETILKYLDAIENLVKTDKDLDA
jgi:hypothetical protein